MARISFVSLRLSHVCVNLVTRKEYYEFVVAYDLLKIVFA